MTCGNHHKCTWMTASTSGTLTEKRNTEFARQLQSFAASYLSCSTAACAKGQAPGRLQPHAAVMLRLRLPWTCHTLRSYAEAHRGSLRQATQREDEQRLKQLAKRTVSSSSLPSAQQHVALATKRKAVCEAPRSSAKAPTLAALKLLD